MAQARTFELLALGAAAGTAAIAFAWIVATGRRLIEIDRVPLLGGTVVATTAVLALLRRPLTGTTVLGLALLLLVFFAPGKPDQRFRVLASIPGAAVLAFAAPAGEGGLQLLTFLAIPILGGLVADFDAAHAPPSYGAIGLGTVTVAAFLALPDTQNIAALTGVAIVAALGAWLLPQLALGGSTYVWVGLLVWIATSDGSARPASAIGVIGAFGLMVIEPVVRRMVGAPNGLLVPHGHVSPRVWSFGFGALQGLIAVLAARAAGVRLSVAAAVGIVAVVWAVIAAALMSTRPRQVIG